MEDFFVNDENIENGADNEDKISVPKQKKSNQQTNSDPSIDHQTEGHDSFTEPKTKNAFKKSPVPNKGIKPIKGFEATAEITPDYTDPFAPPKKAKVPAKKRTQETNIFLGQSPSKGDNIFGESGSWGKSSAKKGAIKPVKGFEATAEVTPDYTDPFAPPKKAKVPTKKRTQETNIFLGQSQSKGDNIFGEPDSWGKSSVKKSAIKPVKGFEATTEVKSNDTDPFSTQYIVKQYLTFPETINKDGHSESIPNYQDRYTNYASRIIGKSNELNQNNKEPVSGENAIDEIWSKKNTDILSNYFSDNNITGTKPSTENLYHDHSNGSVERKNLLDDGWTKPVGTSLDITKYPILPNAANNLKSNDTNRITNKSMPGIATMSEELYKQAAPLIDDSVVSDSVTRSLKIKPDSKKRVFPLIDAAKNPDGTPIDMRELPGFEAWAKDMINEHTIESDPAIDPIEFLGGPVKKGLVFIKDKLVDAADMVVEDVIGISPDWLKFFLPKKVLTAGVVKNRTSKKANISRELKEITKLKKYEKEIDGFYDEVKKYILDNPGKRLRAADMPNKSIEVYKFDNAESRIIDRKLNSSLQKINGTPEEALKNKKKTRKDKGEDESDKNKNKNGDKTDKPITFQEKQEKALNDRLKEVDEAINKKYAYSDIKPKRINIESLNGYKVVLDIKSITHSSQRHGSQEMKEGLSGRTYEILNEKRKAINIFFKEMKAEYGEKINRINKEYGKPDQKQMWKKKLRDNDKEYSGVFGYINKMRKSVSDDLVKFEAPEGKRKNIALKKEDYQKIPEYIRSHDKVEAQKNGIIRFTKETKQGNIVIVLEAEDKEKTLRVLTMYHGKKIN